MGSDKKRSTDAEYQYAGEESGEESLQATQQKRMPTLRSLKERAQQMLPKKGKYRVLLFVGLALYILYKFLDVATPPAKETTGAHEKIATQQLSKPPSEKVQTATKVVEKPIEKLAAAPAAAAPLPASVDNQNTSTMVVAEQPKEAITQIQALRAKVDQMNHSVDVLESSLLSLTNSVIGLSDKINLAEKSRLPKPEVMSPMSSHFHVYYLQALTTGRAWIQSSKRDLTTVKVGDSLPGYGEIENIDVRMNVVSTSSGRLIHYKPGDQ